MLMLSAHIQVFLPVFQNFDVQASSLCVAALLLMVPRAVLRAVQLAPRQTDQGRTERDCERTEESSAPYLPLGPMPAWDGPDGSITKPI